MAMLIKNRQIVPDPWQHADAEGALPDGDVIVPLARFRAERDILLKRPHKIGVKLKGDDKLEDILPDLARIETIALHFPFRDGRCYTHARLLRERYEYKKDIRAVGHVHKDQIFFMHRVGINVFEMKEGDDLQDALAAFSDFSVLYQPATDEPQPLFRRAKLK